MKIFLYLEGYHFLGGILYKKIGTGLLSSYRNQKKILENLGVEYTEKWSGDCDILQINTPWFKSLWLMRRARARGMKIIVWSHVTAEDTQGVFKIAKYAFGLIKKYLTYAYNRADVILSVSEYTKKLLVAYGISPDKIFVQSNGVDLTKFYRDRARGEAVRKKFDLSGTIIGTVGLAIPRKGIDTFIELAKSHPECKFVWFGKIYNSLITDALPKNLPPNCAFTGYVDDILGAFNAIDIFIFPSYEENQGMVLLEAAAVGLPILVRNLPAYEGWLMHRKNCLKANNLEEFKTYLDLLLMGGPLVDELKSGTRLLAHSESLDVLGEQLMSVYNKLTAS